MFGGAPVKDQISMLRSPGLEASGQSVRGCQEFSLRKDPCLDCSPP